MSKIEKMIRIINEVAGAYGLSAFAPMAVGKLYNDPTRAMALYDRIEKIVLED